MIQIRLEPGGEWHRKVGDETACGIIINGPYASRDYELTLDLCKTCHTRHERDTGRLNRVLEQLERDSDPGLYFWDEDEEPTDPG